MPVTTHKVTRMLYLLIEWHLQNVLINPFLGHYAFAQVSSELERVIMSYPRAGYSCGLTFSYHLTGEGVNLVLRTSLGTILWLSSPAASAAWEVVGISESQYLTPQVDEGVELVLLSTGANGSVALDNIDVNFCLPCNFETLQISSGFDLSYDNYSRVFLRTPYTMQVQVYYYQINWTPLQLSITIRTRLRFLPLFFFSPESRIVRMQF